jgi:hypothetical protein
MRLTQDGRRAAGVVLAAMFALGGCDSGRKGTSAPSASSGAGLAGPDGPAAAGTPNPKQAAEALLKGIGEGKATADQFTPAFRRLIAPPKSADDKKAGYAESEFGKWLGKFEGTRFNFFGEPAVFGDRVAFRGRSESGTTKDAFSLRLIKDGAGYKIDWLQRADRMGTEFTVPSDADLAAAQDVVRNFFDALLSPDPSVAHLSMAPAWKRSLAPPQNSAEEFDAGFLKRVLISWRDSKALSYTLPKQQLTPTKDGADFTAVLDAGGGTKTTYAVKLSKDSASGYWLVESFTKQ